MSKEVQQENYQPNRLVKTISVMMVVMFLFLFVLQVTDQIKIDTPAILLLVLTLICGLIFFGFIKSIKWKDFEFNFVGKLKERQKELEKQQRELEKHQEIQEKLIDLTKFLLSGFIGDWELKHLERLNHPTEIFNYEPGETFEDELRHLLSLKFIKRCREKGFRSMREDSDSNNNDLKKHFFITDKGKEYLKRRVEFSEFFKPVKMEE